MTPKEQINKIVNQIYALVHEAEAIADDNGEGFSLDISYGMGGYYEGRMTKERALELVASGVELTANQKIAVEAAIEEGDDRSEEDYGWFASSQGC